MTVTDELNKFIAKNGGNERDALNIALARLSFREERLREYQQELFNQAAEIDRLNKLTQWIPVRLYEPQEYGDTLEFIDKDGNIYKGYWNCGYISCDETGHASKQILDVVGWRLFSTPEVS